MFSVRDFRILPIACALSLASLYCSPAPATLVVNDTWQDGTRTDPASPVYSENGVDADADGDIESAWFRSGTGSSLTPSAGHLVASSGAGTSMSLTTYFTPEASPVTLTNVGDKISLHWVFTPSGVTTTSTSNQDMRIALVDSPGAARVTSDATPGNAAYTGYGVFLNMKSGTLGASSNNFQIEERNSGSSALLSASGSWTSLAGTGTSTTPGYTSGLTFTFDMSVTKTAAGADIVASMTGTGLGTGGNGLSVTFSDTTPEAFIFDTFALRPGTPETTATSFDTSLFQVQFTPATAVPEMSSFLLVGAVGFAIITGRRFVRQRWDAAQS
jgi:hypothetical protein